MTQAPPESAQSDAQSRALIPLLTLITRESLDQDYARVARPAHEGHPPRLTVGVVLLALFGALVTIAALQTSRESASDSATREELISRINDRQEQLADQQQQIADTRTAITKDSTSFADLGSRLNRTNASQQSLGVTTGFVDDDGPGLQIEVADASSGDPSGEVRGSDLSALVNALWAAGATAIAINDQRVTPLSAPRNSGSVVRMNNVSLSSPYEVVALGNPDDLRHKTFTSVTGRHFQTVATRYGFEVQMTTSQQAHVPAAAHAMLGLTYASADIPREAAQ